MRVGIYARVSTAEQQTLPMQLGQMHRYARDRGWKAVIVIKDIGSGAEGRPRREELLKAARRRDLDAILVWKLDRWGRSLIDLVTTLKELHELQVGFISLTEALDLTTSTGRAMTAMLGVFAEFEREIMRERVKAGIAQARLAGKPHGRPRTAALMASAAKKLKRGGKNHSQIARTLRISRTSVRRILR